VRFISSLKSLTSAEKPIPVAFSTRLPMTLFQEGNTVSNNKLIIPVALKTIIIKHSKYNFKQCIHIHNEIIKEIKYCIIVPGDSTST
jgi:hypothetical protein